MIDDGEMSSLLLRQLWSGGGRLGNSHDQAQASSAGAHRWGYAIGCYLPHMRRPLIILVGGLAILHLVLATSNTVDVVASALGWSDSAWRSGNVAWVEQSVETGHLHIGSARMWGYLATIGAAFFQLFAGVMLAIATVALLRYQSSAAVVRRWVRLGVAAALVVWLGLTIGDEVFIAYESGGWERFILLAITVTAAWIAVEVLALDNESSVDEAA